MNGAHNVPQLNSPVETAVPKISLGTTFHLPISVLHQNKKNRMIVISDVQDNHHDNIDFIRKRDAIESQTDKMIPFVYKTDTAGRSSIRYLDFSERYRIPDSNKIKVRIVLI